jgi:hypothetical protein
VDHSEYSNHNKSNCNKKRISLQEMRYNAMLDHYPTAFPRDSGPAFDLTGVWVDNFIKSPEFQEFEEEDIEYVRDIVTILNFLLQG